MLPKNRILVSLLLFVVSYTLLVFLWVYVKAFYGVAITEVAAHVAALVSGCLVDRLQFLGEKTVCHFVYQALTVRGPANLHFHATVFVSNYSYNVPLTLSIMVGLYPFISWKPRTILEALLLLVLIHISYVFLFCGLQIYYALIKSGVKTVWKPEAFLWEFPWVFVNAMVIRFEPFLIGVFLWFRNVGLRFVHAS